MQTKDIKAFGTTRANELLNEMTIQRRVLLPHDIEMEILFCGICHSDLHQVKNDFGGSNYPMVPGHEMVGRVTAIGNHVNKFKVGDLAGVGCIIDSCRECDYCAQDEEMFCKGEVLSFNSPDKHLGGSSYGGYSESYVADERYVLHVPENLDLAATAPLLCAGITVYSPFKHWNIGPGKKVGILGIGGLGHLAIKIAKAMGAHVVVFTTSPAKVEDAKRLGTDEAVLSSDAAQMAKYTDSLNLILDTVSANHDVNIYLNLLKADGSVVLVGLPTDAIPIGAFNVVKGRRSFSGSNIGGIAETQEMLDFCSKHNITADIELIKIQEINEAFHRLEKGDVHYRFVIDMASLKK
ncbi:NAD(P)-dependent alcohol dehydrogenase [Flavobacterium aquicola]|uniref:Putative zinc-type alcohol dehydrogenase-like protein n=1 Tax=Flavobacterium aquicola TaxID=1682742 RepID=A0A3E0EL18_9FLAO|nr:NAD(P)-dependent alcohol dehydrogenase [Flavobacterium aquicola]REG98009.1 putative zinc-type alcohol dehydrogenase-like protein [Flavobacterium aquicola]